MDGTPEDESYVDPASVELSSQVHMMPLISGEHRNAQPINTAGAHLNYYGGHVLSNVKVVQVLYGSGTYMSQIGGTQMGSFYHAVTNSTYFDWLKEYDTPASGTNQKIGRGSFVKKVQITPASSRNGKTITDAKIQAEISAQISKGKLPAPDANTVYMVNFPKGKIINSGGSLSCQVFCAYHGTYKRNGANIYYGVLPDMSPGSGCDLGCGGNPNLFNDQTSVASHELIETVTDAEVGLAQAIGKPLAWYDPVNGEIGDICNANQGSAAGYTVQKEWSNKRNACVDH